MTFANEAIRQEIKRSGVRMWQVADALGIAANTFGLWLRHELPEEKAEQVRAAIKLAQERRR